MPKLTLAERLDKAAQRKARAGQDEARLKKLQRNERTRRIPAGAGLSLEPLSRSVGGQGRIRRSEKNR